MQYFSLLLIARTAFAVQVVTSSTQVRVTTQLAPSDASTPSHSGDIPLLFQHHKSPINELDKKFDILWNKTSAISFKSDIVKRKSRNAVQNEKLLWPKAVVPFQLNVLLINRTGELFQAFEEFHLYTCIRFRKMLPEDTDYVRIVESVYCDSQRGRQGGQQDFYLSPKCINRKNAILHELGHLIGFIEEHTRPDRDKYITIRLENVRESLHAYFEKRRANEVDMNGIPYDYLSIMHFSPQELSMNGKIVIETNNITYQSMIGRSHGLSYLDIKRANMMYKCSERKGCRNMTCPSDGFVGQDCMCWCRSQNISRILENCGGIMLVDQVILTNNPTSPSAGELPTTWLDDKIFQHNNETNLPPTLWGQLNAALLVGLVIAIVIGCGVAFSAIMTVIICAVHRVKHCTQQTSGLPIEHSLPDRQSVAYNYPAVYNQELIRINAGELSEMQTSRRAADYCSLDDMYTALNYTVPNYHDLSLINEGQTDMVQASVM